MKGHDCAVGALLRAEGTSCPALVAWIPSGTITIGELPSGLADGLTEAEEAGHEVVSRWIGDRMSELLVALNMLIGSGRWVTLALRVEGDPIGAIRPGGMRYFGMGNWAWDIAEVRLPADWA